MSEDTKTGANAVTALRPCPFCGSAAKRIAKGLSRGRVKCADEARGAGSCRISGLTWPVDAWNNRAAAPTPPLAEGIVGELRATHPLYNRGENYEPLRIPPSELMLRAADEIERLQAAEAELASIKAGPIVYGIVPPLHERIVPAQGDEVGVSLIERLEAEVAHYRNGRWASLDRLMPLIEEARAALATPTTEER